MLRVLVPAMFLAACNQIYGLDPTIASGTDGDGDGIPDASDNCVAIPNADQHDGDDDGRGDACDMCDACQPCETAADHDEDGDRIDDGCDNCPARANPAQDNADGDQLGDACDAAPTFERRLLFDGFGSLRDEWLESGSQWVIVDDAVAPTEVIGADVTRQLEHATIAVPAGTRWAIEIGVDPLPLDRKLGLFVGSSSLCFLEHRADGTWEVTAVSTKQAFAATEVSVLRMTPTGPFGAQYAACEVPGHARVEDMLLELQYPAVPKLVTTTDQARYRYIDVISE